MLIGRLNICFYVDNNTRCDRFFTAFRMTRGKLKRVSLISLIENDRKNKHTKCARNDEGRYSMEIIDIYSKGEYPANVLSNFAPNAFELDGVKCESMEGFLQSLKFRNIKKQIHVCSLVGKEAKERGAKRILWKLTGNVHWLGRRIKRESREFDGLIARAYSALYQNPTFLSALESVCGKELRHTMGSHNKRATILTEEEFICNLTALRQNLCRLL